VVEDSGDDWALVTDPEGRGPGLLFQTVPEPKVAKNRMHFDLVVSGSCEEELSRLEALGARVARTFETWTVMQDPEGNKFCLSQPPERIEG
jgi:hypothetical protein